MKGNCPCCDLKDVELRRFKVDGVETNGCEVCQGFLDDANEEDGACTCGTAPDPFCPVHSQDAKS